MIKWNGTIDGSDYMSLIAMIILIICNFLQMYVNKKEIKSLKKAVDTLTLIASIACLVVVFVEIVEKFS